MMAIPRSVCVVALSLTLFFVVAPLCSAHYIMYSGESLRAGQSLSWASYNFIMQSDCNLVLYDTANPVWASNTGGLGSNCHVTLQSDANLVIYNNNNNNNKAVWASNTNRGKGNYVLILQRDRNVVIYGGAIWATNTHVGVSGAIVIKSNATKIGSLPANATQESNAAEGIAMLVNT
ncbi:hypothetical protein J5N97_006190 [Dioscorea zingiberensis]|uniref:Bulb-type lectin domain-containing protein n=1 Tax=Dioscorea zingiberensis TaxID=325984 RepID=A0A9D5DB19_9LILI|nr:hypothetical protein J5N97_006190 [Dioscorea zingiberensis]